MPCCPLPWTRHILFATHIFGLDVAVDDALGVALRHRAQHGAQEGGGGALAVPPLRGRHQLAARAQLQHLARGVGRERRLGRLWGAGEPGSDSMSDSRPPQLEAAAAGRPRPCTRGRQRLLSMTSRPCISPHPPCPAGRTRCTSFSSSYTASRLATLRVLHQGGQQLRHSANHRLWDSDAGTANHCAMSPSHTHATATKEAGHGQTTRCRDCQLGCPFPPWAVPSPSQRQQHLDLPAQVGDLLRTLALAGSGVIQHLGNCLHSKLAPCQGFEIATGFVVGVCASDQQERRRERQRRVAALHCTELAGIAPVAIWVANRTTPLPPLPSSRSSW